LTVFRFAPVNWTISPIVAPSEFNDGIEALERQSGQK
jgi:hypothetical protein